MAIKSIDNTAHRGERYLTDHEIELTPADLVRLQAIIEQRNLDTLDIIGLAYHLGAGRVLAFQHGDGDEEGLPWH